MEGFNAEVFEVICNALRQNKPVRFELNNGYVFPREEVVSIDGGPELFYFRVSEEGALVDPEELEYKPGDIAACDFDSVVRAELIAS